MNGMAKGKSEWHRAVLLGGIALLAAGPSSMSAQGTTSEGAGSEQVAKAMAAGSEAMRTGDFATAVERFSDVTKLRPQLAEGYIDLGLAEEQQGDYAAAVKSLDRARTLKPSLRGANLFLGIAEYQVGETRNAEESLKREVKLNEKDPKALMWLGVAELANDEPDAAVGSLDAAAALSPKDPDILYHRGRAHLLVSKESYQQMFAVDPDGFRVHEVLAQADVEAERTVDAIAEYKRAIEQAPHHAGLHEELADLYWASGSTELADTTYREELAIDPYSFTSYYKLGSLRVTMDKPQEALASLEKAVSLDPGFPDVYYYLGRAQVEAGQDAGQVSAGIENLKRASTASGNKTLNTLAFYQLSRVYRRLHQTPEANAALAQFRVLRAEHDVEEQQKQERLIEKGDKRRQLPKQESIPTDADAAKGNGD
jgi:tetratricopeptide (TPR) repeat protein